MGYRNINTKFISSNQSCGDIIVNIWKHFTGNCEMEVCLSVFCFCFCFFACQEAFICTRQEWPFLIFNEMSAGSLFVDTKVKWIWKLAYWVTVKHFSTTHNQTFSIMASECVLPSNSNPHYTNFTEKCNAEHAGLIMLQN